MLSSSLRRKSWSLENLSSAYGVENVIDGQGGLNGNGATSYSGKFEFFIDLKEVKTISGFSIDYMKSWGSTCGSKRVMISTSMDKEVWSEQGTIYKDELVNSQYIECYEPMQAQYVKMMIFDPFDWMIAMSEVYMYENK